jgi:hypothetical protein
MNLIGSNEFAQSMYTITQGFVQKNTKVKKNSSTHQTKTKYQTSTPEHTTNTKQAG